ncbi:MAG TPA: lytic transglycosylase domain-containing protein [Gammaproteobacteria bacterium]|nr:lytic transglycosylase domain-containing protein [Gammaproteobacteria bacterium]
MHNPCKKISLLLPLSWLCLVVANPAFASPQQMDEALRTRLVKAINDSKSFNDKFLAEVWLTDMSLRMRRYIKNSDDRIRILRVLHEESARADIPPEMVLAVIETESAFNRYAISSVGARGLMQIMPFWLREIGKPGEDLFDIRINLRIGCTILRYYLDKEKNDKRKALARYNGSVGKRKYSDKVFNALSRRWYRQ